MIGKSIIVLMVIVFAGVVIYIGVLLYLYFSQTKYIYFPTPHNFVECKQLASAEKINHKGTRMYYIGNKKSDTLVIMYHGNGGSACDRYFIAEFLRDQGVAVILVEYAGYSNDTQPPSEKLIFNDVKNVNAFIKTLPYKRIVLYGESLGSGPASYHSTLTKVESLILVTPFTSLADAASYHYPFIPVKLLLKDKYDNLKYLQTYKGKLIIIHGTNDSVIPYSLGEKLYNAAKTHNKKLITTCKNTYRVIFLTFYIIFLPNYVDKF